MDAVFTSRLDASAGTAFRITTGMARLMALMLLLAIMAWSSLFFQQFYLPKLLVFFGIAASGSFWLSQRRELHLPDRRVPAFMALFTLAGGLSTLLSAAPQTSLMQWAYYLGACMVYLVFFQFDRNGLELLLKVLFGLALLQLGIELLQWANLHPLLPAALIGQHERLFGTTGNQEFLAALLGAGFFIGLHLRAQIDRRDVRRGRHARLLLAIACAALLLGLVLAHNKGGLAFIALYFLWRHLPRRKLLLALLLPALAVAIILFPDSSDGRLLLWLAAALIYLHHPLTGTGYMQFENHYLDAVRELFRSHPALATLLGNHTAMSLDAHNLLLQYGAELGSTGLLLALLFARHAWRLGRDDGGPLGAALLFLLFKSLYTVVLPSITGMLIFLLLLARLAPRTRAILRQPQAARYAAVAAAPVLAALFAYAALPVLSDYYYMQGARALFMGQDAEATEALNRALILDRENADASLALAQASYSHHDYPAMRRHLEDALHYRKNKDSYKIAASMYYYSRRYDDAYALYSQLHQAFPQHLTSLTKLACIFMIRGDYEQAYATAQQALHARPRNRAPSDANNLRLARQVALDSYPHLSHKMTTNLKGG